MTEEYLTVMEALTRALSKNKDVHKVVLVRSGSDKPFFIGDIERNKDGSFEVTGSKIISSARRGWGKRTRYGVRYKKTTTTTSYEDLDFEDFANLEVTRYFDYGKKFPAVIAAVGEDFIKIYCKPVER